MQRLPIPLPKKEASPHHLNTLTTYANQMVPFSGIETNEYRQADREWAYVKCIVSYVNFWQSNPPFKCK